MAELTNLNTESGSISHWPPGIAYDGGFRILGTPIGFGKANKASLRFVSYVDSALPARKSRVLLSPFVATAIDAEGRGLDALHLGFDRKIRMGRMDIRMLPTGLGPGSSQIEITIKDQTIVYTDGIRLSVPITADGAIVPTCDLLLLDVRPGEPRPPSPKTISAKLSAWIRDNMDHGTLSVLLTASRWATLDAAWILGNLEVPIRAQRAAFEMLRRLEVAGYPVPKVRRLEQELPKSGVVLHTADDWSTSPAMKTVQSKIAYVGPGRTVPDWADAGFRLAETEDRPGIASYVKKTGAKDVALGPKCDDGIAKLLTKAGLNVYRAPHPTQMDLNF